MKTFNLAVPSVALALGLASVLSACKKSSSVPNTPDVAQMSIVNAAPKVPYFDVAVNGKKTGTRINYLDQPSSASTAAYTNDTLNAGAVSLTLTDSASNSIVSGSALLMPQKSYTLVVFDTLSAAVKKTQTLLLSDDLTLPGKGKANIRFLQLSPSASAVDIDVFKGTDSLRLSSGVPYVGSTQNTSALSAFSSVNSGTYSMKVRMNLGGTLKVLLTVPSMVLTENKAYTVYLKGLKTQGAKYRMSVQVIQHN